MLKTLDTIFLHHNIDFFCFIAYNIYRLRNKSLAEMPLSG